MASIPVAQPFSPHPPLYEQSCGGYCPCAGVLWGNINKKRRTTRPTKILATGIFILFALPAVFILPLLMIKKIYATKQMAGVR
jgi:hypothetical protein